jgi:hypothetical protein
MRLSVRAKPRRKTSRVVQQTLIARLPHALRAGFRRIETARGGKKIRRAGPSDGELRMARRFNRSFIPFLLLDRPIPGPLVIRVVPFIERPRLLTHIALRFFGDPVTFPLSLTPLT